jgi:hypothetical protein
MVVGDDEVCAACDRAFEDAIVVGISGDGFDALAGLYDLGCSPDNPYRSFYEWLV